MSGSRKIAVVTGAASGLGRAVAARLMASGAFVYLLDRNAEAVRAFADESPDRTFACVVDVTREANWIDTIRTVEARDGGLDILVNVAGLVAGPGPQDIEKVSLEDWRAVQAVNVEAIVLGIKHAVPSMRSRGGGAIVNVASIAGRIATPTLAAYGASKAAVIHYTRTVAAWCARQGYAIRCNCVLPGVIPTPMTLQYWERLQSEQQLPAGAVGERFRNRIPLGQFQAPADIAEAVNFLVSDAACNVTGIEFPVDGGFLTHDR